MSYRNPSHGSHAPDPSLQADALRRQKDAELRRDTVEAMMLEEIVIEESWDSRKAVATSRTCHQAVKNMISRH